MKDIPKGLAALLLAPIALLAMQLANKGPRCLDGEGVWAFGVLIGVVAGIAAVAAVLLRFPEDRRYPKWALGAVALWGIIGGATADAANRWADRSPGRVVVVRVVDRRAMLPTTNPMKAPREQPSFWAVVMAWEPGGGMRHIDVPEGIYDRLVPNQTMMAVHLRDGAFDCPWIESVELPE